MHKLSICAIVKNEAPYLEEWLCYHIEKGVEHFYLYDNGSEDGTKFILVKYKKLGFVTWEYDLTVPLQIKAYEKCIKDHRRDTKWCAFIDVDEFIGSEYILQDILNSLTNDISVLAIHWLFFGSNGQTAKEKGLVIERFTKRETKVNRHLKSIVKMSDAIRTNNNPHAFVVGRNIVNEKGIKLPRQYALITTPPTADIIWLNHYHTKSYDEYIKRKLNYPKSSDGIIRPPEEIKTRFKTHDFNEVEDLRLLSYASIVKDSILAYQNT